MELREKRRKLITISVPVYNEEDNIVSLMKRLRAFSVSQPDYDFEFMFTDNASQDATYERLAEEAKVEARLPAQRGAHGVTPPHQRAERVRRQRHRNRHAPRGCLRTSRVCVR